MSGLGPRRVFTSLRHVRLAGEIFQPDHFTIALPNEAILWIAYCDLEKERLEMLGEAEGTWLKVGTGPPPKGGWGPGDVRPEPRWYPILQIWWLPENQRVNPVGNHASYATSWVNPDTMEITKEEQKAAR